MMDPSMERCLRPFSHFLRAWILRTKRIVFEQRWRKTQEERWAWNPLTNPSRSSNGSRFQHLFHRAVTRPRSRNIANLLLCAVSLSSTRKAAQRRVYCDRHERLGCYVREQAVCNSSSTAQKRRTSPGPKACYHLGTSRYCDYAARSAGERPNREIYRRRRNAARISKDDVPRHVFAVLDLTRISAPTFFESG